MIRLQADIIRQEVKVLEVSVWACETHGMPETARSLRVTMEILLASARCLELEAAEDEPTETVFDPADNGNQGS